MEQAEPEQMEVDQDEANNGTTSSSDDSDFEEVDVSMEDMAHITKLETDLEANPNLYDVHLQVRCPVVLAHCLELESV